MSSLKSSQKSPPAPHPPSFLQCAGCGTKISPEARAPFQCPRYGSNDGVEHIIVRRLASPIGGDTEGPIALGQDTFVRYRKRLHSYTRAIQAGWTDEAFVEMLNNLDKKILDVDKRRFGVTPLMRHADLEAALEAGPIWVKDETNNVSGSHKARHLFGILLHLKAVSPVAEGEDSPRLAIASCGNAALAAAVVARADQQPLDVFIPTDANPKVVTRLEALGATLKISPRQEGVAGDPCVIGFRAAVEGGALPFSCQGPDNGLTIEGGETLAYELVDQLALAGESIDRIFVQVGGAALASACAAGLTEAYEAGLIAEMPRFHALQTRAAFPLVRAYERIARWLEARLVQAPLPQWPKGEDKLQAEDPDAYLHASLEKRHARADKLKAAWGSPEMEEALTFAADHRDHFMWPWESAPHSVAHGILDDETYDWLAVIKTMLQSGGYPIVVDEDELEEANTLGRKHTGINADHTGTSGLTGLIAMRRANILNAEERSLVFFTGVDRETEGER